jgi:hypothetical protein
VREELMNRATGPGPSEVGLNAPCIERGGDFRFGCALLDKSSIYRAHDLDFVVWPWHQDNAISLEALLLAHPELGLLLARLAADVFIIGALALPSCKG